MKYHTTYRIKTHPHGIEPDAVPAKHEACTAVLVGSLLYPPDGSYSASFESLDGRTAAPLSDDELFKAWTMLAMQLSESRTLSPFKREMCALITKIVRDAMREARQRVEAGERG